MALYEIEKNAQGVPTGEYKTIAGGCLWADAPLGSIQIFCTHNLPSGYHECDGSELSKTEYADLYAVIGDAFKGNKTPTTGYFCLPDLRECTLKGASDTNNDTYTIGTHQKIDVGEFLDDRVQKHTHNMGDKLSAGAGGGSMAQYTQVQASQIYAGNYDTSDNNSGRYGATTEVKSVGAVFGIKIRMVALPADLASGVADYMNDQNELSDYEEITLGTSASNAVLVQYDGFINININSAGSGVAYISSDNKTTWKMAWNSTSDTNSGKGGLIVVTKGDYVYAPGYVNTKVCYARFYKNRDYTKRT